MRNRSKARELDKRKLEEIFSVEDRIDCEAFLFLLGRHKYLYGSEVRAKRFIREYFLEKRPMAEIAYEQKTSRSNVNRIIRWGLTRIRRRIYHPHYKGYL